MAMPNTEEVKKGMVIAFCWVIPAFLGAVLIGLIAKVAFSPEFLLEQGINVTDTTKEKIDAILRVTTYQLG